MAQIHYSYEVTGTALTLFHGEYQNYEHGSSRFDHKIFCVEVLEQCGDHIKIEVKNHFVVGDTLELMTPSGNIIFDLISMNDQKGNAIVDAKGSGHLVYVPVPAEVDMRYALLIRYLPSSNIDISAYVSTLEVPKTKKE